MSKVLITKSKLDTLAEAVSAKSHESVPLTIDEMTSAVLSIPVDKQNKTVTPTESAQSITADTGFFGLETVTVNPIPSQYIVPEGAITITTNGTGINVSEYATATVNVPTGSTINNQSKTVTPTEERQYTTPDTGYTGLSQVIVEPISSTYVGTGITRNPARTVNGRTVTIPGPSYFTGNVSTEVAEGTAGTPTATKSTANNNSITITPSVTNDTGYITGGTINGTSVTVTASEVVSGTKSITENGTNIDVTNYAMVNVNVPTVNISQDQNGYIVLDDDGNYGGGGGSELAEYIASGVYPDGDYTINNVTTTAQAFANTSGTITLTFPDLITTRRAYAFENTSATKISMPKLTNLYPYAFSGASLLSVFAPSVTCQSGGGQGNARYFFNQTANLQNAVIGSFGTAYLHFYNCTSLTTVDVVTSNGRIDNAFQYGCTNFNTLILRGNSVLPILTATSFDSSCFKSGGTGGEIYIPKVLYDHLGDGTALDYKAATNWSTIDGYGTITWKQIEGSIYETQYADGTPIE